MSLANAEKAYNAFRKRAGGKGWRELPEADRADWEAVATALQCTEPVSVAAVSETGLTNRKVWGLLKYHRDRGHVSFDPKCGVWQSNTARMTEAIKRAAALLRSNGWKVTPP